MDSTNFSKESERCKFVFSVQTRKLWLPKELVTLLRPGLRILLGNDFNEDESIEVKLPENNYTDVIEWLKCSMPPPQNKPVSSNIHKLTLFHKHFSVIVTSVFFFNLRYKKIYNPVFYLITIKYNKRVYFIDISSSL